MADAEFIKRRYGYPQVGVKRSKLQSMLVDRVKEAGIEVHYGKKMVALEQDDNKVVVRFEDGTEETGSFAIGADGLHSLTRSILFGKEKPVYTGLTQTIGISPRRDVGEKNEFSQTFGVDSFFITYPFSATHVAWAGTLREEERPEEWKGLSVEDVEQFKKESLFASWKRSAPLLETAERVIKVGVYDRPALEKWSVGRVTLIGDAAHPTSPHLGQGANQCMEDAYVLCQSLVQSCSGSSNVTLDTLLQAFKQYEGIRIARNTMLVNKARAQGEVRVNASPEKCQERNALLAKTWSNVEVVETIFDSVYSVDFK
eukprot:gene12618-14811_t